MGTSWLALTRERLKTIASSSGFLGNSVVLATVHAADLDCLKRFTPGSFQFAAICESEISYAGVDAPTGINAYVYAYSPGADGELFDDLATQLKSAWLNPANYPTGEQVCSAVTLDACESLIEEPSGSLLRAHFVCYFAGD
ncbi:MAG: hypothetical protein WCT04_20015 [Planctomycetota bacterium]